MHGLITLFANALTTLLVIISPIEAAAVFAGLSPYYSEEQFRRTAYRATFVAAGLLFFFGFCGHAFLESLGISLPAFRIAGGILLFITASKMLFGYHPAPDLAKDTANKEQTGDIAVFPLAIPLLSGPGSITATILLMSRTQDIAEKMSISLALLVTLAASLACLLSARLLQRTIGNNGIDIMSRVMGVILAAMSVQFVTDGLHSLQL
ncbi:MAG: MarC family protein [Alphaproteobacteria bacterium]|nr:MarC family protein [Alphaproteobacteria bacterium]